MNQQNQVLMGSNQVPPSRGSAAYGQPGNFGGLPQQFQGTGFAPQLSGGQAGFQAQPGGFNRAGFPLNGGGFNHNHEGVQGGSGHGNHGFLGAHGNGSGRGWQRNRGRGGPRGRGRHSAGRGQVGQQRQGGTVAPVGQQGQQVPVVQGGVPMGQQGQLGYVGMGGQNSTSAAIVVPVQAAGNNTEYHPNKAVSVPLGLEGTNAAGKRKMGDGVASSSAGADTTSNKDIRIINDDATNLEAERDKRKDWCFRCRTKGHVSAECKTDLFCNICESEEHVAASCPIKKKTRPVAHAVGYAVDNLGFYHIPHAPYSTAKKDGITALITVTGGSLTEVELVGHLKHLVPGKFEWDVQMRGQDKWVAPFPSKSDLRRTINFGSADLKNGMHLKFEDYEEDEYFGHELPFVWMRVLNLPKVLRSYEVLWAIGTMFGATQRVDMITTRKNNFGRFEVAVLNPNIIPSKMDVVIGTRFFELDFEIEAME